MDMNRREFIRTTAGASLAGLTWATKSLAAEPRNGMPYRTLGRTGEHVSLLGLGGNHLDGRRSTDDEAVRIIRTAIDEGINFLDNARSYNDGHGERNYGRALRDGYRDKVFLMTKTRKRNGQEARKELEESLRHFETDYIDLWQVHAIESNPDIDNAYAEDGVLPVAIQAQKEGLVRYIGFSGHDYPDIHRAMIERGHPWDSVQMPLSILDYHWLSFQQGVLPVAIERNIGVIAMKTLGGGRVLRAPGVTPEACLRYSMSLPISTLVCGMDSMELLRKNLDLVKGFTPMTAEEMGAFRAETQAPGETGEFEKGFKAGLPFV